MFFVPKQAGHKIGRKGDFISNDTLSGANGWVAHELFNFCFKLILSVERYVYGRAWRRCRNYIKSSEPYESEVAPSFVPAVSTEGDCLFCSEAKD